MKCKCCGKNLTECFDTYFNHYFECKKCYVTFDDKGNLIEFN